MGEHVFTFINPSGLRITTTSPAVANDYRARAGFREVVARAPASSEAVERVSTPPPATPAPAKSPRKTTKRATKKVAAKTAKRTARKTTKRVSRRG